MHQNIEPFVSNESNPITDCITKEGIRRCARSLRICFDASQQYNDNVSSYDSTQISASEDHIVDAREDMCLGSLFGGMALANAKLGAVHGFAGPLGGMLGAPHGGM